MTDRRIPQLFLTAAMVIFCAATTYNQTPGTLDPAFGIGGVAITRPPLVTGPGLSSGAHDMVIQSDGKIVMVASAGDTPETFRAALVRYTADGSLDASFGDGGFAYIAWTAPDPGTAGILALQIVNGQEYIIVAGANAGGTSIRCERFTPSGALDTAFGTGGVTSVNTGGLASSVGIQADQKILLAGGAFPVARLNADGTPDAGYGPGGISRTQSGIYIRSLYMMSNGQVLAVGDIDGKKLKGAATRDFAVARFNASGTLDTTFGTSGKTVIDFTGKNDLGIGVAVDAAGRIVLCGEAQIAVAAISGYDAVLVRLSSIGKLDTTFGTGGKTSLNIGDRQDEFASISFQANGKIVASGEGRLAGNTADVLIARYNPNGTLDTSFDSDGWTLKDFYGNYDYGTRGRVWVDPTCSCEKYLVSGGASVTAGVSLYDIIALRYFL
ncbi:MAG: hypothetical protein ABI791_09100 [Acidobacteriota bacterium]